MRFRTLAGAALGALLAGLMVVPAGQASALEPTKTFSGDLAVSCTSKHGTATYESRLNGLVSGLDLSIELESPYTLVANPLTLHTTTRIGAQIGLMVDGQPVLVEGTRAISPLGSAGKPHAFGQLVGTLPREVRGRDVDVWSFDLDMVVNLLALDAECEVLSYTPDAHAEPAPFAGDLAVTCVSDHATTNYSTAVSGLVHGRDVSVQLEDPITLVPEAGTWVSIGKVGARVGLSVDGAPVSVAGSRSVSPVAIADKPQAMPILSGELAAVAAGDEVSITSFDLDMDVWGSALEADCSVTSWTPDEDTSGPVDLTGDIAVTCQSSQGTAQYASSFTGAVDRREVSVTLAEPFTMIKDNPSSGVTLGRVGAELGLTIDSEPVLVAGARDIDPAGSAGQPHAIPTLTGRLARVVGVEDIAATSFALDLKVMGFGARQECTVDTFEVVIDDGGDDGGGGDDDGPVAFEGDIAVTCEAQFGDLTYTSDLVGSVDGTFVTVLLAEPFTMIAGNPSTPVTLGRLGVDLGLTVDDAPVTVSGAADFNPAVSAGMPQQIPALTGELGTAATSVAEIDATSFAFDLVVMGVPAQQPCRVDSFDARIGDDEEDGPVTTRVALDAAPEGDDGVLLRATVSPVEAAGQMEFLHNGEVIAADAVTEGRVGFGFDGIPAGEHRFAARFVPFDPEAYSGSTSVLVTVVITGPVEHRETTTSVAASSPAPGQVELRAQVRPAAAGTVEFREGDSVVASGPVDASGDLTRVVGSVSAGAHSYSAHFSPADPAAFGASDSQPVTVEVAPLDVATWQPGNFTYTCQYMTFPAIVTNADYTVSVVGGELRIELVQGFVPRMPAGIAMSGLDAVGAATVDGRSVALSGTTTYNPALPGDSVFTFPVLKGSLGSDVAVTSVRIDDLDLVAHSAFGPAEIGCSVDANQEGANFEVPTGEQRATATVTSLKVKEEGNVVLLEAEVTPAGAAGQVTFLRGGEALATVALAGGRASHRVSGLGAGVHSFTAEFTPVDAKAYRASVSGPTALTLIALPGAADPQPQTKAAVKKVKGLKVTVKRAARSVTVRAKVAGVKAGRAKVILKVGGRKIVRSVAIRGGRLAVTVKSLSPGRGKVTVKVAGARPAKARFRLLA